MIAPAEIRETEARSDASLVSARDREVLRSFARRIDPTDAGAHNNLGVLYYNKGLYEEAVGAFMRALELDPRMLVAQRNLEIAYLNSGAADHRIAHLREQLANNPTDRDIAWEIGRTSALLGRHEDAIQAFAALLEHHPDDLPSLIQLALSVKEVGDIEIAQQWLERALEVDPNSSLVHFYLGEISYNRGLLKEALMSLKQAIDLNPENHEAWYLLGFVLGDAGLEADARDATQRAFKLNPALSKAQANLALAQPSTGYIEKSRRDTMRVVQLEVRDESPLNHYNLGLAFRKKGDYAEALGEYELAVHSGEDRDLVEQAKAEVHLLNRDGASALALYDALIQRQTDSPKLWNERGVALHQLGRYAEAEASYRRAIELEPEYALALNNLGVALYHANDPEGAFDAFKRALETHGTFVKARLNQALLLFKAKKLQLALEAFRAVLAVDAEHPVAWNGIGLVLSELKRFEDARNAFARAIQARPRYAEAHYNLSFTLSNLGDFDGALRETKLALELDPYYVPQKLELAIDQQYEDTDLSIQPDLGEAKRADEAVADFTFDPGVLDTLFKSFTPAGGMPIPVAAAPVAPAAPAAAAPAHTRQDVRASAAASALVAKGDVFANQGLWGEALERYREARQDVPDLEAAMIGEATALLRLGRAAEARIVTEQLLQRRPHDVEALLLAATARSDSGDAAAALAALDAADRIAPARRDIHRQIGDVKRRLSDSDGAIAAYRLALSIDADYALGHYQLATVLIEREQPREAEVELLAALELVPTYTEATLALAQLRRATGRPADALPMLIELLERDPYHFDALIALGETLMDLGRRQDAAIAFARVLRFDPTHAGALYNEGALFAEQRRYREAQERWRQVIELAPNSEFARRARRSIRTAGDLQQILGTRAGG